MPYVVHGTNFPYIIPLPGTDGECSKNPTFLIIVMICLVYLRTKRRIGRCMITLEQAGPTPARGPIMLRPDDIRGMAGNIIKKCVEEGGGVGGRVPYGLEIVSRGLYRYRFSNRFLCKPCQFSRQPIIEHEILP